VDVILMGRAKATIRRIAKAKWLVSFSRKLFPHEPAMNETVRAMLVARSDKT